MNKISALDLAIYSKIFQNKGELKNYSGSYEAMLYLLHTISTTLLVGFELNSNAYGKFTLTMKNAPGFYSIRLAEVVLPNWDTLPEDVCKFLLEEFVPKYEEKVNKHAFTAKVS